MGAFSSRGLWDILVGTSGQRLAIRRAACRKLGNCWSAGGVHSHGEGGMVPGKEQSKPESAQLSPEARLWHQAAPGS